MTNILLFVAATGAMLPAANGPIRIDGTGVTSTDLAISGTASVGDNAVTIGGGRVTFSAAKQKALDAYLAGKPVTFLVSIVDTAGVDTTAFTFGSLKLLEKDKGWYLVNNPEGEWHQIDLGKVVTGTPLKFALVGQDGTAHIWKDGKDVGNFPFKPGETQPLAVGSPDGEANPFKGEIRMFDITPKPLKTEDLLARLNPTSGSTGTSTVTPTNAAFTKSTTVVATLVDLSEVPDPQSILPYRNALIIQEYKITSVTSGNIEKAGAGATIRVARWGVVGSKKTSIADQKKGDTVTLTLEKMTDHPTLDHQYTIDNLPSNYTAAFLLDMSMTAPGG